MASFARLNPPESAQVLKQTAPGVCGGVAGGAGGAMRTPQSAQSLPSGQLVASVGGVIELGPPSPQMASFARFNPAESAHVLVQTPPGTSGGDVGGDGGMMRGPQSAQSEPSGQLVASVRGVIELGPPSPA